jgi:hypothetical protein
MTDAMTMVDVAYSARPSTIVGSCWPISRKTSPSRRKLTSRQTALTCRRLAPETNFELSWPAIRPAMTTARTPDTCSCSPSRYAAKGVASDTAFRVIGSDRQRRIQRTAWATSSPIRTPPTALTRNCPTADQVEKPPPVAADTATARIVRAVASLSSPSPWISVMRRGGRPTVRPTARAATGSGGAIAAPRATPAASVAPATKSSKPTPTSRAVARTSETDRLTTVRRFCRIATRLESSAAL